MIKNKALVIRVMQIAFLLAILQVIPIISLGQVLGNQNNTREARAKWWLDARFGMMIHWGAYSQSGGYWKGVYEGGYSEWLKFRQIPNHQYDSLIRDFNPVDFDATEWVRIATEAGMKYMVFTAKHHDGFALYNSNVSDYDIIDMTRFGRDPVAELAAACQKAGIKFGVYYSVDRDWHHPDAACDDKYKQCNFWDYPHNLTPGAMERWHKNYFPYAAKQVEELVTQYPIDIVWFDGIGLKTMAEVALLDSIIHKNRPNCLINSRISNFFGSNDGDYGSKGDNETPGGYQAGGWENPGTLGFSYGYSEQDSFMSPQKAVHNLIDIVSKGGNYLLNVGPDGLGNIIPAAASILKEMGSWLDVYGSSIYGADGFPVIPPENIRITVNPHQFFVHLLQWPGQEVRIPGINQLTGSNLHAIREVYLLSDSQRTPLNFKIESDTLLIDLVKIPIPVSERNPMAEVLVLSDGNERKVALSAYPEWKYSASLYILTTPEGADLHVSARVKDFPLLVRLNNNSFDFSQANSDGGDLRFSSSSGIPLAYQIEEWDMEAGQAAIWVSIPEIRGNSRQEISLFWGNSDAYSESKGSAVFNHANGYLTVLHMNEPLVDEAGSTIPVNSGAKQSPGRIGGAMRFEEGQGISCGDSIRNFPTGSKPVSTEAWFRGHLPNGMLLGWGNEEKCGKVTMQFVGPPHIRMDGYWSGANVSSESRLQLDQWIHVVHTWQEGDSRIYINGRLDGSSSEVKKPLAIKSPAGMWIGGWKDDYWFSGEVDEARISNVARSGDWIKLQYENQKPLQTLIGPPVQLGESFSVSIDNIVVDENQSVNVDASAGGAIKVYWVIRQDGQETIVAADRFSYSLEAGRVSGEQSFELLFRAIYLTEIKTITIPVTIRETIPDPVFTLLAPGNWNGRDTIAVIPKISNQSELLDQGVGTLNLKWNIEGGAVLKKELPGRLLLTRSQFSGNLKVKLEMNNGGKQVDTETVIKVIEPENDPWVRRTPGLEEKPANHQFFVRDDANEGTIYYNGKLDQPADSVFLTIYAGDKLYSRQVHNVLADKRYAFNTKLVPELVLYRLEFGAIKRGQVVLLNTVTDIVCGDAYIINGQSNAEANDYGRAVNPYTSNFLRSFGCADTDPEKCRLNLWGNAVSFDNEGAKLQIGYWGIELGRQLIEKHKIPICIINGAVGGSRIDVHQRNDANPTDSTTIYGRLLWRIRQAGLTHGIRGVLWHQGENDQGAAGPTGRFGWEDYKQNFIDMAAGWKTDYPNIRQYYIFQIWPRSCAMTEKGSDNVLREVQRTLPQQFSNMGIMSTLGIKPPGGCHFPPEGYAEIAHLICPLMERDNYGEVFDRSISPPDLIRAYFSNDKNDQLSLEFDQPVVWNDSLKTQFYLDEQCVEVASGSVLGNILTLRLKAPTAARTISYLDSKTWSQDNLLWGVNGIAALTFWRVEIMNFN